MSAIYFKMLQQNIHKKKSNGIMFTVMKTGE